MESDQFLLATLLERPNRFLSFVSLNEQSVAAFVPNPGRMHELMVKGKAVMIEPMQRAKGKTQYDLVAIHHDGNWVSIDSRLPNRTLVEWFFQGLIPELLEYSEVQNEVSVGRSRLDLKFTGEDLPDLYLEAKSCTLVEDGVARFPDAPTTRGRRHLQELEKLLRLGYRAIVAFVIARPDAIKFEANKGTDPEFSDTLSKVIGHGVEAIAYASEWSEGFLLQRHRIPIHLH